MCVILDEQKLFYAPVPKIACTSIKLMFFKFENGFEFQPYKVNGKPMHIHNVGYKGTLYEKFPTKRIESYHRVSLVRDPVKRFLSAYGNRVVHHKELSRSKAGPNLRELGLEPNPDLGLFIEKFEDYSKAHQSIFHHTRPMVDFLGEEPGYYAKVYRMEEIGQFATDMSERLGAEMNLGRHQTGGPKLKVEDLTSTQIEKIKAFYAEDYKVYGEYF